MPYRPASPAVNSFPGRNWMVMDELAAMRHAEAWKACGGLDRLRELVATWHPVNAAHTNPVNPLNLESVAEPINTARGYGLRMRPVADFDDAFRDLDTEPAALTASERLAVMLEIMQRDTGNPVNAEKAAASYSRNEELRQQTSEIAARLERAGVPAYRRTPFDLFTYYVHSGAVTRNEQFRRIMFLPSVAALVRAPKVKELECFLESHPFARMFTFTSGPRVALPDLRDRIQSFHRAVSRLSSWMRREYGVEMVFRSTELGKPEIRADGTNDADAGAIERDADGVPTFHVHAHTLVWQRQSMTRNEWTRFMRAVWEKWEWFWDDGRSVRDARELCKYVTKPAAILTLSDAELAALAGQLERLKLVSTLQTLRQTIRSRRDREMRLDKTKTPDGWVFREVADWNRYGKPAVNPANPVIRRGPEKIEIYGATYGIPSVEAATEFAVNWKPQINGAPEMPSRIVARLVPSFAPGSLVAEPRVCVLACGWHAAEVAAHPFVKQLRERTADEWQAALVLNEHAALFARVSARASSLRVHVSTPTVPDDFADSAHLPGFAFPDPKKPPVPVES